LDKFKVNGHAPLARHIVNQAARHGLAMAHKREMQFDDSVSVPQAHLNASTNCNAGRAIIPITLNCTVPPIPELRRAYQVGQILRRVIEDYDGDERIAVIGTGGLSHEPGGPRYFFIDEAFDRWFLDLLRQGDHEKLLVECTLERMEEAGSGGTAELLAWALALAFTQGPAEVLGYAPSHAWRSGTGFVIWPEVL
jgi:aromatic ring-opening dioxygenase catalytic subunit (LigB family)